MLCEAQEVVLPFGNQRVAGSSLSSSWSHQSVFEQDAEPQIAYGELVGALCAMSETNCYFIIIIIRLEPATLWPQVQRHEQHTTPGQMLIDDKQKAQCCDVIGWRLWLVKSCQTSDTSSSETIGRPAHTMVSCHHSPTSEVLVFSTSHSPISHYRIFFCFMDASISESGSIFMAVF